MPSNHLILCHPLSSCLQSFPASGSFPVSQFSSGGQRIRVSASASVLPMNIQDRFPLGSTGGISLQSKGLSRAFSNTAVQTHQFFGASILYAQLSHPYMTIGKTIALTRWTFVGKGTLIIVFFWSVFSKCLMFKIGDKLQAGPIQTKSPNFNTFKLSSLFK